MDAGPRRIGPPRRGAAQVDLKVFAVTSVLVFLAKLADKTPLAR
ncbi:MAG: hypothetical protein M0Z66_12570 [Thermaerobacter sp.]|nr:hypothetical protein [Thermaerobacter sp.]